MIAVSIGLVAIVCLSVGFLTGRWSVIYSKRRSQQITSAYNAGIKTGEAKRRTHPDIEPPHYEGKQQ